MSSVGPQQGRSGLPRLLNHLNLHAPVTAVLLSSGVHALVHVFFCPLASSHPTFRDFDYNSTQLRFNAIGAQRGPRPSHKIGFSSPETEVFSLAVL